MNERGTHRTTRAFTLVELLVVVAIISLLLAMLLPALNKARDVAKTVKCLSMLKQIGVADSMYVAEYRGWHIPNWINTPSPLSVTSSPPDHVPWYNNSAFREALALPQKVKGSKWISMPKSYICPNATWSLGHPNGQGNYDMRQSYGQNVQGMGAVTQSASFNDATPPLIMSAMKSGRVASPSAAMKFADGYRHGLTKQHSFWYNGEVKPAGNNKNSTAVRHDDAANVLFYDGHGETMQGDDIFAFVLNDPHPLWDVIKE